MPQAERKQCAASSQAMSTRMAETRRLWMGWCIMYSSMRFRPFACRALDSSICLGLLLDASYNFSVWIACLLKQIFRRHFIEFR